MEVKWSGWNLMMTRTTAGESGMPVHLKEHRLENKARKIIQNGYLFTCN